MTVIFEADREAFLARTRRARRLQDQLEPGSTVDLQEFRAEWQKLLSEVVPIELIPGTRYRVIVFAAPTKLEHMHAEEVETGRVIGFDKLSTDGMGFVTIEGMYEGRFGPGMFAGLMSFVKDDGSRAALADMDVLRAETSDGEG